MFPLIGDQLANTGPLLPHGAPVQAVDTDGPAWAVAGATGASRGVFTEAMPGTVLRDSSGRVLPAHPKLRRVSAPSGKALYPVGLAQYGWLAVPGVGHAASASVRIGRGLFNSVGVTLMHRKHVRKANIRAGSVFFRGVRRGVSQLFVVLPEQQQIEEYLILNSRHAPHGFGYRLWLPHGARAEAVDGGIVVVNRHDVSIAEVTAPEAVDAAGHTWPVTLTLHRSGTRFTVRFAPDARVVYPVAIDPTYTRYNFIEASNHDGHVYPTADPNTFLQATGMFDVDYCGDLGGATKDFHPATSGDTVGSGSFGACSTTNASSLVTGVGAGTGSVFTVSTGSGADQGTGLTVRATSGDAVSKGDSAAVVVSAPSGTGIVSSTFRGHTDSVTSQTQARRRCRFIA